MRLLIAHWSPLKRARVLGGGGGQEEAFLLPISVIVERQFDCLLACLGD